MKARRHAGVAALLAAVLGSLCITASGPAAAQQEEVARAESTGSRWFVEMRSPPTSDGSSLAAVRNEKNAFRKEAQQAGIAFKEKHAFDVLWNGVSVEVSPAQVAALGRLPSVKAIYPVETLSVPPTSPGEGADLWTALAQTGASVAQEEMGFNGAGVRVAVMDTGVDFHHPDLGGCFGPGCRVAVGWDFVGDAFNADPSSPAFNPVAVPDPVPDDCNGHGTHVAGIIGASGNPASGGVRGVAPAVTFGAYRVFGCNGSTTADIMIAAMERALADGMQVLNMSIGSSFQWPQYPTAQASDRLVNRGVAVVASIGNSGTSGLYAAGAPGTGKKVIGVASFDNTHVAQPTFTIAPDGRSIGYAGASGAPLAPASGSLPMARTGTPTSANDGCAPLPAGSLAGRAALIRRGTCSFHTKAINAQNAGAAAVVLYNNAPGFLNPTVAGAPAVVIPVVATTAAEGAAINGFIATGGVTLTWTDEVMSFANPTGNLISSFSSFGMAADLSLKPDIGAPGGSIYSTYPLEKGRYASISGTSMASPHTAGAVALLLQARPRTNSQSVRAILQNSADPKPWFGNPSLGFLDNVHRQGAGMLDIVGALTATTRVEPSKLSLGESEAGPSTQTLTVTNDGAASVTYMLSHVPALATGANTFSVAFFNAPATVAFGAPGLTVPAGGSAAVDVTITANAALADRGLYGGYIVFTPTGGGAPLRVPYAGFKGDYQSIRVLVPTANGFPRLCRAAGGGSFVLAPAAVASFTMADVLNVPNLCVHLDHQSRRLRVEIVDAASGKSWHRAFDEEYLGRNATATGFFAFAWDGVTLGGNKQYTVPNGTYKMRLTVQKALGDDANPAHLETWESPAFTIARP